MVDDDNKGTPVADYSDKPDRYFLQSTIADSNSALDDGNFALQSNNHLISSDHGRCFGASSYKWPAVSARAVGVLECNFHVALDGCHGHINFFLK